MSSVITMTSTASSAQNQVPHEADPNNEYIFRTYPDIQDWQWAKIHKLTRDGQKCLLDFWFEPTKIEGPFCDAVWDKFNCWAATPAGERVQKKCPEFYGLPVSDEAFGFRDCSENGTWTLGSWTNYSLCLEAYKKNRDQSDTIDQALIDQANTITDIYFIGGVISLFFLSLTLFIFCFFKSLQCTRVSIHKHLILSFIFRFIILIVMFEPFVSERELLYTYRNVEWLCKLLTALQNYTMIAIIFWTFVEGLFLTIRILMALSKEPRFAWFYLIGWVGPLPFTLTWALCMHFYHDSERPGDFVADCWQDWSESPYTWIIAAPIAAALAVNLCFLVIIISILVGKLTARNNVEAGQSSKAIRAIAVLVPLLGITNFLFFYKPTDEHVTAYTYRVTNALMQSLQGIFVSVIYCFLNGEVRTACQKKWQRYKMQRLNEQQNSRRRTSHTSSFFLSQTEVLLFLAFGRKVHAARSQRGSSTVTTQNGIELTDTQWHLPTSTNCNSPSDASFV